MTEKTPYLADDDDPTLLPYPSWRSTGRRYERGLCDYTEFGGWSGELYVCDEPNTRRHRREAHKEYDVRQMRRATPEENRRVFAAKGAS